MASSDFVVHIVDDEETVRSSLSFLLSSSGFLVRTHQSATAFLRSAHSIQRGCLVTDVRMPDMSGVELLRQLREADAMLPAIVITGQGDLRVAVEALHIGALDFIEKPFDADVLIKAIQKAMEPSRVPTRHETNLVRARLDSLTEFEVQVLTRTAAGLHSNVIAAELGIGTSIVESCRARLMAKVHANTLSELVRMVMETGGTVH